VGSSFHLDIKKGIGGVETHHFLMKKNVQNLADGAESIVTAFWNAYGIPPGVLEPWSNSECRLLLHNTAAPEGSHTDEIYAHTESAPSP
jgi:hypothetical protein